MNGLQLSYRELVVGGCRYCRMDTNNMLATQGCDLDV